MEVAGAQIDEIQFRDVEIKSLSGWLGLFIHLLVVPVIFLGCFILYALGGWGDLGDFTTYHCYTCQCGIHMY